MNPQAKRYLTHINRMSPKLFVAFYRPRYGNYQHWALYIENGEDHLILEVVGQHPTFKRNTVVADPKKSRSFRELLFIAVLREGDVARVESAAQSVTVDNETIEWDCQDYVLEVLDELEAEYVLDADEEEYIDAREILRERRGAII